MFMKHLFLFFFISSFFIFTKAECSIPTGVQIVLNKAGNNRSELLAAINHYKKLGDPLKLKAVYFLISNMDIHYSVDKYLRNARGKLYTFDEYQFANQTTAAEAFSKFKEKHGLHEVFIKKPDVNIIKAQFLIKNIEHAFSAARNSKFFSALKFEDFCEYVLPYRTSTEPISDWREIYRKKFTFLTNTNKTSDSKSLANILANDFRNWFTNTYGSENRTSLPRIDAKQLLFYKKGPCEDISDLIGFVFRSQGIPVALDEVAYWGTASGRHYFNTIFNDKMIPYPIYDISTKTFSNTPFEREPSKVIRRTFSKQKNVIASLIPANQIPAGFLRSRNFIDVTAAYWKTNGVKASIIKRRSDQPKYAFLSVFNDLNWKPIWWGKIVGNSATFNSMCQGVVYLPQYYLKGKLRPAGFPIVSGYSKQVILEPNFNIMRSIKVFPKDKYLVFRKGMHYNLHFWSINGWKIIGTKMIKDPSVKYLEFSGVPLNSLLLLLPERSKNLERPFTIASDETQQWW